MIRLLGAVLVAFAMVAGGLSTAVRAEDPTPQHQQLQADEDLLTTLYDALRVKGLPAVEPHVAKLEQVLAAAPALFGDDAWADGHLYVLVDGQTESITALLTAAQAGKGDVAALNNPYHLMSLYLGAYYNEIGRSEDALRVLDAGLALSFDPEQPLGESIPDILAERGAAFVALKRWDDALASYDRGLSIPTLVPYTHGLLLRGRGFALVELERLDDGEAAYEESLKFAPDSEIAKGELDYIAHLRAGGKKGTPGITLPKSK